MKLWPLLGMLALAVSPAVAEDVRFPDTFKPALMIHLPKGWTAHRQDVGVSDVLKIETPERTVLFFISRVPTLKLPDDIAASFLKTKSPPKTKAKLAGLDAFLYRGTTVNQEGLKLNLKLIVARIDPKDVYTYMMITPFDLDDKALAPANALVAGITLIKK